MLSDENNLILYTADIYLILLSNSRYLSNSQYLYPQAPSAEDRNDITTCILCLVVKYI